MRLKKGTQFQDAFEYLLEHWIKTVKKYLEENCTQPELSDFKKNYIEVLNVAEKNVGRRVELLYKLDKKLDTISSLNEADIFKDYVNALSFDVNGKKVFLPSFSDEAFREITKLSFAGLSPYRGIYYAWKLGEIYNLFAHQKVDEAKIELLNVFYEVETDFNLQKHGLGNFRYTKYLDLLNLNKETKKLPEAFKAQIKLVKQSLIDLIFKIKASFLSISIYPSRTSTHFYLSGLRFYWFPHIQKNVQGNGIDYNKETYHVQSTDSGIFKLTEHYGTLIDTKDIDAWHELLEKLPAGSLVLDLTSTEPTEADFENIKKFELWSYLITMEAYNIMTKTLNLIDMGFNNKAVAYFMNEVKKNPMRKIYFDTGIYKMAELAGKGKAPRIIYLTTNKSKVEPIYFNLSKTLWEQFMDTEGISYHLLNSYGWEGKYEILSKLTLMPSKNLSKYTNILLSIRDKKSKKIAHGVESLQIFLVENIREEFRSFKIEDMVPIAYTLLKISQSFKRNFDLKDIIIGVALPFTGRFLRAILRTPKIKSYWEVIKEAQSISQRITTKNVEVLKE